jgi:surfeit locus 1 family protein
MSTPDYSFIRRPVWLAGHVIAIAAVIGFIALGLWQLDRRATRSELDDTLRSRLDQPAVALGALVGTTDVADVEYRRAIVTGTYDTAGEVILQARSFQGRSGHEVLTPLVLVDGTAVVVDRGWVPIDVEGPPVVGAEPSSDTVTVTGYVRLTQERSGLGPVDPATGVLDRVSRVDLDRLQDQVETPLAPVWLQLAAQEPPQDGFPLTLAAPQPGGGPPHLSYAVQWFAFAGVVIVAYPLLMRRTARRAADDRDVAG